MATECIKCIIIVKLLLQDGYAIEADDSADETDGQSRNRADESSTRRNGNQTCNDTADESKCSRFLMDYPFTDHPADTGSGSGGVCSDEGIQRNIVDCQSTSGIETEPAEQKKAGANHRHRDIMRLDGIVVFPFAKINRCYQSRNP
ncbi:hypothetical protein SDC9_111363 [bioreactor metagenome]|uniref:Uncharacterized protein n=1 Tax=bioreactor metagenome TaxID=1076179 RepID=A0A645BGJ7_9ZZZZ